MMSAFAPKRILVTGGAGFIGSNLTCRILAERSTRASLERVVVYDSLTYAGHRESLVEAEKDGRFAFVYGDICDRGALENLFAEHAFDSVLHLAAESHVDRSIESADEFVRTNVNGTFTLIDVARRAWTTTKNTTDKSETHNQSRRFVHVSTDEVFGALGATGAFTEASPYAPNSPYAASKAASDLLVRSYVKTHEFPAVITNTSNNYGPKQLPEKLIPLMITNAAEKRRLPVYGEGKQVREWIHVDDHADGLWAALTRGVVGESYNFGSGEEIGNLQMVELLCDLVDEKMGRAQGTARSLIEFVPDRKGHDFRYAIDSTKAARELSWHATGKLATRLGETVDWYLANAEWCAAVASEEHRRFQSSYYAKDGTRESARTGGGS